MGADVEEQLRALLARASARAAVLAAELEVRTAERDELRSRIAHEAPALLDVRGTTYGDW